MCVLVRYVDPSSGEVKTKLLELLELNATDCSAEKLYSEFKTLLGNLEIPVTNVIEMASDGASVMVGKNNSFASRFVNESKIAIVIKCVSHFRHNCKQSMYVYLTFLKFTLNYFNSTNAIFQSNKPLIHEHYSNSKKILGLVKILLG